MRNKRVYVSIINATAMIVLIVGGFVIHKRYQAFKPYASLDKEYVQGVIESGQGDSMIVALQQTETARAMAMDSNLLSMRVAIGLVGTFTFILFLNLIGSRRQRQPRWDLASRTLLTRL
jgi:hypothetical protein